MNIKILIGPYWKTLAGKIRISDAGAGVCAYFILTPNAECAGLDGRGAPEFDIVEANLCPTSSASDLHRCPNDTTANGAYQVTTTAFP